MSFETKTEEKTRRIAEEAQPALNTLAQLAAEYRLNNRAQRLQAIQQLLLTETFELIVLGSFNAGKSTFLNAMLGRVNLPAGTYAGDGAPLPSHQDPCTAILTTIHYAEQPGIVAVYKDGRQDLWTIQQFLEESTIRPDPDETKLFFDSLREFHLRFPSPLGRAGIVLVDSPGLGDNEGRDQITLTKMQSCDAAIVMLQSNRLADMAEQKYIKTMLADGLQHYFTVVNIWEGYNLDERSRATIWNRIVHTMRGGPNYDKSDKNFEAHNIYLINVRQAKEARLASDTALLEGSGMARFQERLSLYLERERRAIKVARFVEGAKSDAADIQATIARIIPSVEADQKQFQEEYQRQLPRLDQLRQRRDRLPDIFTRAQRDAEIAVQTSFEDLINSIRAELPDVMQRTRLHSLQGEGIMDAILKRMLSPFQKRQLTAEATQIATDYVNQRVSEWQTRSEGNPSAAEAAIEPILTHMIEEIEREVAVIEQGYAEIDFALTGWQPGQGDVTLERPSVSAKITGVALSALTMQPEYAYIGFTQGGRGLKRDLGIRLGIGIALAAAHAPLIVIAPVAMAGSLMINILWGADNLEREIKAKTTAVMIQGDASQQVELPNGSRVPYEGLRGEPARARPMLAASVRNTFTLVENAVTAAVAEELGDEETRINNLLDFNSRNVQEKQQLRARMDAQRQTIVACCAKLDEANTIAKQT